MSQNHVAVVEDKTTYTGIALSADWERFFIFGEYALLDFEREYMHTHDEKRGMISGGYRINDFTLHYTYSFLKTDDPKGPVREHSSH